MNAPISPETLSQLGQQARDVLLSNWTGQFTKPAPNLYPHQWNWDAGFIALGYSHFDMSKAEAELRHLFQGQWSNGMLPQIVFGEEKDARYFPGPDFWQTADVPHSPKGKKTSGITMPPVHGFALLEMYKNSDDPERSMQFLKEMYPKVLANHRYLYSHRDPNEEGLVYVRHPWEPGTDNSPTWDPVLESLDTAKLDIPPYQRQDLSHDSAEAHRPTQTDYDRYVYLVDLFRKNKYDDEAIYKECPFLIQDPLFNGILAWSNESLIEIGGMLGEDVSDLVAWNELTVYSMNDKLWNEETGNYDAWDLANDQRLACNTSSGILPMCGLVPTQEQAEMILLKLESSLYSGTAENPTFWCPTYQLDQKNLDYEKYWRGPIWINMNWLLYRGLLRYDMVEAAERVRTDSLQLLANHGFFEYFDPRRNQQGPAAYGTKQFSWSAALCLDFLKEE
ncbi:MAG: glycoside hydrolase [Bacteroidetes bacterium]|nr:glycoside hydrolase [Bacteroidota bacterium]